MRLVAKSRRARTKRWRCVTAGRVILRVPVAPTSRGEAERVSPRHLSRTGVAIACQAGSAARADRTVGRQPCVAKWTIYKEFGATGLNDWTPSAPAAMSGPVPRRWGWSMDHGRRRTAQRSFSSRRLKLSTRQATIGFGLPRRS